MNRLLTILKELRTQKGIGQKNLACALHCSVGTISNYENGIHDPDLNTLVRLADFFDVTVDYLLGRTDCCLPSDKRPADIYKGYSVNRFLNLLSLLPEKERLFLAHLFCILEKQYRTGQNPNQSS